MRYEPARGVFERAPNAKIAGCGRGINSCNQFAHDAKRLANSEAATEAGQKDLPALDVNTGGGVPLTPGKLAALQAMLGGGLNTARIVQDTQIIAVGFGHALKLVGWCRGASCGSVRRMTPNRAGWHTGIFPHH